MLEPHESLDAVKAALVKRDISSPWELCVPSVTAFLVGAPYWTGPLGDSNYYMSDDQCPTHGDILND